MAERTTIHNGRSHSGELHVDYEPVHNRVFLYMASGGFSHCLSMDSVEAKKMAEALMKAAFKIEAATPQAIEQVAA